MGNRRVLVLGMVLLLAGCGVAPAQRGVSLLDLDGRVVDPLRDASSRAQVLVFTRTDCPIANRYAPEIRRLYEHYAPLGVSFWLVYADPDEAVGAIRKHLEEYGYNLTPLRDVRHELVALTGVGVTPEAAVFVPGAGMLYRGRIDDRYADLQRARPRAHRRDLEEALEAVLAGRPVEPAGAPAVGCAIRALR
jgi:hypothetical protein